MSVLKMPFQGVVYEISERENYTRVVAVVEVGYESNVYNLRIYDRRTADTLEVGDCVLFTGGYVTRDGLKQFVLDSMVKKDFKSCGVCKLPLTWDSCLLKHNVGVERLTGCWKVVHTDFSRGRLNTFFERADFVFSVSTCNKMWTHKILKNLVIGDLVDLIGWRDRDKVDLTFAKPVNISTL